MTSSPFAPPGYDAARRSSVVGRGDASRRRGPVRVTGKGVKTFESVFIAAMLALIPVFADPTAVEDRTRRSQPQ